LRQGQGRGMSHLGSRGHVAGTSGISDPFRRSPPVEFQQPKMRDDRVVSAMPNAVSADSDAAHEDPFLGTPYYALQRVAAGGMGEVFLVAHRELGREFVAKVLHKRFAADERLLDRMRIEAQTLGRLNHANIVSVTGFGTTQDGRPFIVMERLLGRTLAAEIAARGAIPAPEAVAYVQQLLAALQAAHALGIVHRDIKPDNLFLVDRPDGTRTLKVLDFGVARVLPGFGEGAPQPLALPTDTGLVVGTPRYVSPEGALGKKVDERADIYATGLVLYLLLAGKGPFDHLRNEAQILGAHANVQPVAPSAVAGGSNSWPAALDKIVLYALRKNPADRFQTANHFSATLQDFVSSMGGASPAAPPADATVDSHSTAPRIAATATASPQSESREGSAAAFRPVARSAPSARQLLLFVAVVAMTAVAVSQLVRVVLVR